MDIYANKNEAYAKDTAYAADMMVRSSVSQAPSPPLTERILAMLSSTYDTLGAASSAQTDAIHRLFGPQPCNSLSGGKGETNDPSGVEASIGIALNILLERAREVRDAAQLLNARL